MAQRSARSRKSYARTPHGNGATAIVRIESSPLDELSVGVPGDTGAEHTGKAALLAKVRRAEGGRLADPQSAAILGHLGGKAKAAAAEVPRLAQSLGLRDITAEDFKPYVGDAAELAEHECERLAQVVGGGVCGTAPSTIVASAALQTAGSRYAFARGDVATGSKLANDARQNLLAAHELCAREAAARPRKPFASLRAALPALSDDDDDNNGGGKP